MQYAADSGIYLNSNEYVESYSGGNFWNYRSAPDGIPRIAESRLFKESLQLIDIDNDGDKDLLVFGHDKTLEIPQIQIFTNNINNPSNNLKKLPKVKTYCNPDDEIPCDLGECIEKNGQYRCEVSTIKEGATCGTNDDCAGVIVDVATITTINQTYKRYCDYQTSHAGTCNNVNMTTDTTSLQERTSLV